MKKFLSIILSVVTLLSVLTLAGCKKKETETTSLQNREPVKNGIIYSTVDLSKHIEIGKYKKLKVNTSDEVFEYYYDSVVKSDIENGNFYKKKTKGTIKDGDVVNIDYTGYKDGKKFEGGEAKAYDLEIGSGSFIPGFEDSLIGEKIGSTFDIGVTFPEEYGETSLAGKYVTFTVTANFVTTTESLKPRQYYKDLGYKTLSEYEDATTKTAIKNYLLETFLNSCKIVSYPDNELRYITNSYVNMFEEELKNGYGMSLDDYLNSTGTTRETYENQIIEEQVKPTMDTQMAVFSLLQKEGKSVTKEEVDARVQTALKDDNYGVSAEDLLNYMGEYYFEYLVALEKALDILYNYAVIS